MKVFIIAAMTADGFIGRDKSHLSVEWTTKADKHFFVQRTKEAGATVFGRTTFDTFKRAMPGRRTIVYTSRPESVTVEGVETTSEPPADLVARLNREGAHELAICGGAQLYAEFLEANLVDELYISVHPVMFGSGVPLFNRPLQISLQLLDTNNIGDDTVMLHYKVVSVK